MEELHEKGKGFPFTFITRLRKRQRLDKLNECVRRHTIFGDKLKRVLNLNGSYESQQLAYSILSVVRQPLPWQPKSPRVRLPAIFRALLFCSSALTIFAHRFFLFLEQLFPRHIAISVSDHQSRKLWKFSKVSGVIILNRTLCSFSLPQFHILIVSPIMFKDLEIESEVDKYTGFTFSSLCC